MAQVPKQSKRLTMVELAKEAGVSTTTVSKVLNQLPGVGAQTRTRIQQLIEQNEYVLPQWKYLDEEAKAALKTAALEWIHVLQIDTDEYAKVTWENMVPSLIGSSEQIYKGWTLRGVGP